MTRAPFRRDPNRVPDTQTTRGVGITYEDSSFVTGDSPATHDVNTDLGRNGRDGYVLNDGTGDFKIEISNDGSTYGSSETLKSGETKDLEGLDIDRIRLTWVSDSSYRMHVL